MTTSGLRRYIARTASLYNNGGNNFISQVIAGAGRHGALGLVTDEFGSPIYAPDRRSGRTTDRQPPLRHLPPEPTAAMARHQWAVSRAQAGRANIP